MMNNKKDISTNKISVCKGDLQFKITYANEEFLKTTGYLALELINESIDLLKHPNMPQVIYMEISSELKKGLNYDVILLDITKEGEPYWSVNNCTINKDSEGNIEGYTTRRKPVPKAIIQKIEPLYNDLLEIEKSNGIDASESYLKAYLKEEIGKSYKDYLIYLFYKETHNGVKDKIGKKVGKTLNWFFQSEYIL